MREGRAEALPLRKRCFSVMIDRSTERSYFCRVRPVMRGSSRCVAALHRPSVCLLRSPVCLLRSPGSFASMFGSFASMFGSFAGLWTRDCLQLVEDVAEVVDAFACAEPFGTSDGAFGEASAVEGFVGQQQAIGGADGFEYVESGNIAFAH